MKIADDRPDITVELAKMEARQSRIELLLETVVNSLCLPQTVNISDISRILGVSVSNLRGTQCYLLPKWGVSEFPDGRIRWKYETFLKHMDKSPTELKEEYKRDMLEQYRQNRRKHVRKQD